MKILTIGGRGFIGKKLVERLIEEKNQVDILSRSGDHESTDKNDYITFIKCDLLDATFDFEELFANYDVIFNCAGELNDESLMYSLHVEATRRMILACKKVGKAQKRKIHWVQLSSVGAYGVSQPNANTKRIVTEETLVAPVGPYEVSKTLADKMVMKAADEFFSYSILRPSNVYGTSMPNDSIRQWGRMIHKGMFVYIGPPGAIVTYVHVDDVVDALLLCGFDDRAKNETFNISNDCDQEEFASTIATILNTKKPRLRVPETLMRLITTLFSGVKKFPLSHSRVDALVARTKYSTDKLRHVLGYAPKRDVLKTINEVFR